MTEPKRLPEAVKFDRWDLEDHQRLCDEMDALPGATASLAKITPTARAQMFDGFNLLHRYNPKERPEDEIADDHIVDLYANREMVQLQEFKQVRQLTVGDPVASGQGLIHLEREYEVIHDKQKLRQKQADKLKALRDELDEKLQELLDELAQSQPQPSDDDEEDGEAQDSEGEGEEEEGSGAGAPTPGGQGEGDPESESEGQGQGQGQGDGEGQGQDDEEPEGDGEPELSERAQDLQQEIEDLQQAIKALEKGLKEGLAKAAPEMRAALARGLAKAAAQLTLDRTVANMCGIDPGTLTKLPVAERLALARKFAQHADLAEIAKLWGPFMLDMLAERQKVIDGIPDEIYDVTLGRDLMRLTPAELIRLDDEDLVWDFLKDYAEGRLMNYKVRGKEKVARGGIVMCEDGSLSMEAFTKRAVTREKEAKAIMGGFANVAKMEGRSFHLVHFGGPGMFKTISFVEPGDWTVDRLIEAFELFFCSGTCFRTPLTEAQRILQEEFAATGNIQSDIVFLTDGYAPLSDDFLENFLDNMHQMEAQAHAILLGDESDVHTSEPMNTVAEGRVYSIEDLSNNGKELRSIFRGL